LSRNELLAWGVHLYTALGLVLAAFMAVLIVRGGEASFYTVFTLMFLATVIDSSDGYFARRFQVDRVLPSFNGRRLDDITDFHTYTSLPLLLIWRSDVLSPELAPWLLVPLLASAYGFSQTDAKTKDGYFLGFPSLWNVVAFYLFFFRPPEVVALGVLIGLAILTFVPIKYLYPSQSGPYSLLTNVLGAVWALMLIAILVRIPEDPTRLLVLSLFFPIYYMSVSWALTFRHWAAEREGPLFSR
jgi:phosphatidylcholine synthase